MPASTPPRETVNADLEVLVFGPQARSVGQDRLRFTQVALPMRASELLRLIEVTYPELAPSLAVSRLAVNHEFVAASSSIQLGDEVGLVGLISGG